MWMPGLKASSSYVKSLKKLESGPLGREGGTVRRTRARPPLRKRRSGYWETE